MEPFLICMKASKGLPLQASASGSGATVVAVVAGTVVTSVAALAVMESSSVWVSGCAAVVGGMLETLSLVGLVISSVVSGGSCALGLKSGMCGCVGLSCLRAERRVG